MSPRPRVRFLKDKHCCLPTLLFALYLVKLNGMPMGIKPMDIDVLCVGHAAYDLVFQVDHHPEADEKLFAAGLAGGGEAPRLTQR